MESASDKTFITQVVQDNGRGFDPRVVGLGGNGLRSMHQLAASLGGTLQILTPGGCRPLLTFRGPAEGITHWSGISSDKWTEIVS